MSGSATLPSGKSMKLAVMQPYFLPYIGYFQLIAAVDTFIVYDNIKYTKKGWINRNRMLQNGKDVMFSLPLQAASDYLDVRDREIATDFNRSKLINQIAGTYKGAPNFASAKLLIEEVLDNQEANLFRFLHQSILIVCKYFDIKTKIIVSSSIPIDHGLKSQDKVLALCKAVGAGTYVNAIGGIDLYSRERFYESGVELKFIQSTPFDYQQFGPEFVPWLSIVDVLMFNPQDVVKSCITSNYQLI